MIRYLIKNNLKLMMRSVTNILLFIVTPVILVALLSSAFHDLLEHYEAQGSVRAGYFVEAPDTDMAAMILAEQVKMAAGEQEMSLREYPNADPEEKIREENLSGFVVFETGGGYRIYENGDRKFEAKALEYLIGSVDKGIARYQLSGHRPFEESVRIEVLSADYMEPIDSSDYYGIIEVVYFGWCAIVCGAGIFSAEKKYRIGKKLMVSGLSEVQLYLAKFLPMVMVVTISTLITAGITVLFFGVHWGNPLLSALLVVLSAAAATAFGLMFYGVTQNMVVTIIGVFVTVWLFGFFGGSFETYMFSSHARILKELSPVYHVNRALTELSCMGQSDYTASAVWYCLAILIVSSGIAVAAGMIRRRIGK